jgi:hypothetical protein
MKSLSCACIALMLFVNVSAQSLFTKASSGFSKAPTGFAKALQTILLDYPNNFHGINGELLISQGEYEHYASTVSIPGAESCVIGRYHSYADTTASFQAVLYRTDNFEEASKQYRSLFKQLKSSPITLIDGSKYYLNGEMGKLDESLDFTVSTMVFPMPTAVIMILK